VSEDGDVAELLDTLSDDYARAILVETSVEPMSANTLSDRCDASLPTVYRRIERLQELDLIEEQTRIDPGGSHHKVYAAKLSTVSLDLDGGDLEAEIEREETELALEAEEDVADRFTRMWEGL
jgi:DNA-binding transcriptional ArsR family regulator